jgi:hypothetical protein
MENISIPISHPFENPEQASPCLFRRPGIINKKKYYQTTILLPSLIRQHLKVNIALKVKKHPILSSWKN